MNAPVFKPDTFVSYLCGSAMMTLAEKVRDESAIAVAESVGRYFITRLNGWVDEWRSCVSAPRPKTMTAFITRALSLAAYLARLWQWNRNDEYLEWHSAA